MSWTILASLYGGRVDVPRAILPIALSSQVGLPVLRLMNGFIPRSP